MQMSHGMLLCAAIGLAIAVAVETAKAQTNIRATAGVNITFDQAVSRITELGQHKSSDQPESILRFVESIPFPDATNAGVSLLSRADQTTVWMKLLEVIDENIDLSYDTANLKNTVALNLVPPPLSNGMIYPSGVAPEAINDPVVRSNYEAALAENSRRAVRAAFQTQLRRVRTLAALDAERFFRRFYSSSKSDQNEIDNCVLRAGLSQTVQKKMKTLFEGSE